MPKGIKGFQKGHTLSLGVRRNNAGRKKNITTILREKTLLENHEHAENALLLHISWMQDKTKTDEFRSACAKEVMNRIWGLPKARMEGLIGFQKFACVLPAQEDGARGSFEKSGSD